MGLIKKFYRQEGCSVTLVQLQYFKTLARVLHYTRAAEELHIAQPSLSYSINELEKELGVRLFAKEDRKVTLTAYGEHFLPYVEAALVTLNDGVEELRELSGSTMQEIRLGYFHSISSSLIPTLMEDLYRAEENKNLRFQFTESTSHEILDQLKQGELDLAFCMHRDENLESVPVMHQQLYLAVPKEHPLAKRKSVTFADFGHEPIVMLDKNSSLRILVDRFFMKNNTVPNVMFVVRECNAALQYVALNFCVSILPQVPAMETEKIAIIPIEDAGHDFVRTVYFTWMKNRSFSPAVKRIRNYIAEHYTLSEE